MKSTTCKGLVKLLAVAAVLASPTALAASGKFEKNIEVDGSAIVQVSNESGSVTVRGGDVDKVTIHARIKVSRHLAGSDPLRAQQIISGIKRSPPVTVEGNRVSITKVERRSYQKYASISYEITVPKNSDVEVRSVSGNVLVSGVTGDVDAASDKGEVTLADAASKEDARIAMVR